MKLLSLVLTLALSSVAMATISPYNAEQQARFLALENQRAESFSGDATGSSTGVITLKSLAADGLLAKRTARATLNCASSGCSVGAHGLGVTLPAAAVVTQSYIYVVTQLTDTGTCTVAISCEDANNIKTATDITGSAAGAFIAGQSTGTAASMVSGIAAACEITATVADGGSCAPLTGKVIVYIDYMVAE